MTARSIIREAAQALRFNRQRSILTTVSLAWGVACFVILNGYGDGFHRAMLKAFRSQGQDLVLVFGGRTSTQAGGERAGRRIQLERTDVEAIREAAPMIAAISPEMIDARQTVVHGYRQHTITVRGVHTEYGRVRNQTMATGRWIVPEDEVQKQRVAVLGAKAAEKLFSEMPPLGEEITIDGLRFTVIGVLLHQDAGGQLRHARQRVHLHSLRDQLALPRPQVPHLFRVDAGKSGIPRAVPAPDARHHGAPAQLFAAR